MQAVHHNARRRIARRRSTRKTGGGMIPNLTVLRTDHGGRRRTGRRTRRIRNIEIVPNPRVEREVDR